jgi:hypothetical protein
MNEATLQFALAIHRFFGQKLLTNRDQALMRTLGTVSTWNNSQI